MPLPTPNLDDRKFQDLVDQAKRMIPRYCPEWTDHNVSDPGVALIELFAWMTDLLLYRVNQVPDKMHTKFLEMIGVTLEPPRAATAPITFYLSAAQEGDVLIPEGVEVATSRTENQAAVVFSTEAPLMVRVPKLLAAFTRSAVVPHDAPWLTHDLKRMTLGDHRTVLFSDTPRHNDAFCLAFETDLSNHVLCLDIRCDTAGGAGVDPKRPPLRWEAWQGPLQQWVQCEVEHDGTGGFNMDGEIILHVPKVATRAFQNLNAYWLRVRLTETQSGPTGYKVSPEILGLQIESRGGTVQARHAVSVQDEYIGESDGTPGQRFTLRHAPVLPRDPERDRLVIELSGEQSQAWTEVADFADSGANDLHYCLESYSGELSFGPVLPQPTGGSYVFGATPTKGATLRFSRYMHGGGVIGNVTVGALNVLKSSLPYVARLSNRTAAVGGRDVQNLEEAKLRAARLLRTRTRAVASDDYEHLACELNGVARACCIAPGVQPPAAGEPKPGSVMVVILPAADHSLIHHTGRLPAEWMTLSAETRSEVLQLLDARKPVGTHVEVRGPQLIWVSVEAKLRLANRSDPALVADIQERSESMLYHYLNPYTGGPAGKGWPFGRELHVHELYALLQSIPHVEFVEDIKVNISESGSNLAPRPAPNQLSIPRGALICSELHRVRVISQDSLSVNMGELRG